MTLYFTKIFKKQYRLLPQKMQGQFDTRLKLFLDDPHTPALRNHPLQGKYAGYWSISINGDLRALYKKQGEAVIIFALIGTHSQLYG